MWTSVRPWLAVPALHAPGAMARARRSLDAVVEAGPEP